MKKRIRKRSILFLISIIINIIKPSLLYHDGNAALIRMHSDAYIFCTVINVTLIIFLCD